MLKRLAALYMPLRKMRLRAKLRMLNLDATVLQAQMLVAPLQLAELRAQITDTQRELETLQ